MSKYNFGRYLSRYFLKYIPSKMNYSENTIKAYRDTFTVFLKYCTGMLHLKSEKVTHTNMTYFSISAIQKLLASPNNKTKEGERDLAILTLLYDKGVRVQKTIDVNFFDL